MNNFFKTTFYLSLIFMVCFDINTISNAIKAEGGAIAFETIMTNFAPIGILLAVTAFLKQFEKKGVKLFSVIFLVVNILFLIVRIFAIVLQVMAMVNGSAQQGTSETILIVEFVGYTLLLVANVLFSVYMGFGKLKKASVYVFSFSALALLVDWIVLICINVNELLSSGENLLSSLISSINSGFIFSFIALVCYSLIYFITTDVLEEKRK